MTVQQFALLFGIFWLTLLFNSLLSTKYSSMHYESPKEAPVPITEP